MYVYVELIFSNSCRNITPLARLYFRAGVVDVDVGLSGRRRRRRRDNVMVAMLASVVDGEGERDGEREGDREEKEFVGEV